jgi:signal transduction histidine kinase
MHAVLAYARLAADRSSDAKLKDFMTRIVSSGERLLALLNDLLDLSKLEAGRTTPQLADADLSLLIAEVTRELEPLLAGKQLSLEISRDAGCVEDVMAAIDRRQMAQVFHNVLSNAVKFSPERGRLSVRIACAELPAVPGAVDQMRAPALQVAFSDQGVGIPEQELETVFDSFVQSTKTRTNAGGTGLGLAICRQIMDLHGGQITARNNDGPGATFVITVPRAIRRKAQAGAAA